MVGINHILSLNIISIRLESFLSITDNNRNVLTVSCFIIFITSPCIRSCETTSLNFSINPGVNIAFHANTGGSTPGTVHGHLLNISLGGVRIIFHHKVPFSRGNILDECSMTLPGKGVIIFSLLVEYVNNSQDDEMVLGGHYHMLPKAEGILIKEYVTEMMRKMAKQAHDNQLPDTAQD